MESSSAILKSPLYRPSTYLLFTPFPTNKKEKLSEKTKEHKILYAHGSSVHFKNGKNLPNSGACMREVKIKLVAEKEQAGKSFLPRGSHFIGGILSIRGKRCGVPHFLASRSPAQIFTRLNALPFRSSRETGISPTVLPGSGRRYGLRSKHDQTKRADGNDFHRQNQEICVLTYRGQG